LFAKRRPEPSRAIAVAEKLRTIASKEPAARMKSSTLDSAWTALSRDETFEAYR
jgi:hypothetical protein